MSHFKRSQRKYSNHAIETVVTLGMVFALPSRQTEGFINSLFTLLNLCVNELTGDVIACNLTSKSARDLSRVPSMLKQIEIK